MPGDAGDWKQLASINDPLPQAMKMIAGDSSGWLHMLVSLCLFGLVVSFRGTLRGDSRQIYALGRAGVSQPTAPQLAFQAAHAQARDAVHLPLAPARLASELQALHLDVRPLHSAAAVRHVYPH